MLTLQQMQTISQSEYVVFSKDDCRFYSATEMLFKKLVETHIIDNFSVYILDQDFENLTLKQLIESVGWTSEFGEMWPSKPQIFMKGEYIGGNWEFYKSRWNVGEGKPNLINPMRF